MLEGSQHQNPAIAKQPSTTNGILAQSLSRSSQATISMSRSALTAINRAALAGAGTDGLAVEPLPS